MLIPIAGVCKFLNRSVWVSVCVTFSFRSFVCKCKCKGYSLLAEPYDRVMQLNWLYLCGICQLIPLKMWPNTAQGCNHQSTCMPQLQPLFVCLLYLSTPFYIYSIHVRQGTVCQIIVQNLHTMPEFFSLQKPIRFISWRTNHAPRLLPNLSVL